MTFDKADTIMNNIYLSLMIHRGAWWFNPDFGSRLHFLSGAKYTDRIPSLAEEYCQEALQWLLDIGRATNVDALAGKDVNDIHRLNLSVAVTQADGREITFEIFVEVV